MKFVAGQGKDQVARLLALSKDKGHTSDFDVAGASAQGFWVHDDVAAAYDGGQVGALSIATSQAPGTLKVTFTATPACEVKYTLQPGPVVIETADGVASRTYAAAGSYTATAVSPGRSTKGWTVVVAPAASRRKKTDKEADDG